MAQCGFDPSVSGFKDNCVGKDTSIKRSLVTSCDTCATKPWGVFLASLGQCNGSETLSLTALH